LGGDKRWFWLWRGGGDGGGAVVVVVMVVVVVVGGWWWKGHPKESGESKFMFSFFLREIDPKNVKPI
jgi:hypothetical protein